MATEKFFLKYVLYENKVNSIQSKILKFGKSGISRKDLLKKLEEMYSSIHEAGGLKYDGRCGLYTIYKTKKDSKGRYYVLHIER